MPHGLRLPGDAAHLLLAALAVGRRADAGARRRPPTCPTGAGMGHLPAQPRRADARDGQRGVPAGDVRLVRLRPADARQRRHPAPPRARCSTTRAPSSSSRTPCCSRCRARPFLYYGDEIGMGDNIWLPDRDASRTPMQWTPDRNAGFSTADPGKLYLPVVQSLVYNYTLVNVESQLAQSRSLLHWVRNVIHVRKAHPTFGLGIDPGAADQPRVGARLRARVRRDRNPVRRRAGAHPVRVLVRAQPGRRARSSSATSPARRSTTCSAAASSRRSATTASSRSRSARRASTGCISARRVQPRRSGARPNLFAMAGWTRSARRLRPRDHGGRHRHAPHRVRLRRACSTATARSSSAGTGSPTPASRSRRRASAVHGITTERARAEGRPAEPSWSPRSPQTLRTLLRARHPGHDLQRAVRPLAARPRVPPARPRAARRPRAGDRPARARQGRRPLPQGQAHARGGRRALRRRPSTTPTTRERTRSPPGGSRRRSPAPTRRARRRRSPTCTAGRPSGTRSRRRASRTTSAGPRATRTTSRRRPGRCGCPRTRATATPSRSRRCPRVRAGTCRCSTSRSRSPCSSLPRPRSPSRPAIATPPTGFGPAGYRLTTGPIPPLVLPIVVEPPIDVIEEPIDDDDRRPRSPTPMVRTRDAGRRPRRPIGRRRRRSPSRSPTSTPSPRRAPSSGSPRRSSPMRRDATCSSASAAAPSSCRPAARSKTGESRDRGAHPRARRGARLRARSRRDRVPRLLPRGRRARIRHRAARGGLRDHRRRRHRGAGRDRGAALDRPPRRGPDRARAAHPRRAAAPVGVTPRGAALLSAVARRQRRKGRPARS